MVSEKYSASMDEALIADIRADAEATGVTLSSWLAEAATDRLRLKALRRVVEDWESEHGPITEAELADLDRKIIAARGPEVSRRSGRLRRAHQQPAAS